MKNPFLLTLLIFLPATAQVHAQDDTATHRKVYAETEASLDKLKVVAAMADVDGLDFELKGWSDAGNLKKIVARVPGEDGDGSESYYYADGALVFVFRHYAAAAEDGDKGAQMEDRFYLKDGALFKWLGSDKKAVPAESEDFKAEAERLKELSAIFVAALSKKPLAAGVAELTGTFVGIEQGDYAHWTMKNGKGEEFSFFVLNTEASVEAVLNDPDKFVGKPCRITWKKSMENIPEAGGKIEIEQILSVKWLDK